MIFFPILVTDKDPRLQHFRNKGIQVCFSAKALLLGWMYITPSPLHFKDFKSQGKLETGELKRKRRIEGLWLSGSVGRLSSTPAGTKPWIREGGKKETDPISSPQEHDGGIKAILKFNGPCRVSSTCNLSQAARSIHWKGPVLELHYCYCHSIYYNTVLLEEALQPAQMYRCLFVWFVTLLGTTSCNS